MCLNGGGVVCFPWPWGPARALTSSFLRFPDHIQRRITVGRTPLDEWSAHRRDLYLTSHSTPIRQISMPLVGFQPIISAGKWPQMYSLDHAATGTGLKGVYRFSLNIIESVLPVCPVYFCGQSWQFSGYDTVIWQIHANISEESVASTTICYILPAWQLKILDFHMIIVTSDVKFTYGFWEFCIAEEVLDQKYWF